MSGVSRYWLARLAREARQRMREGRDGFEAILEHVVTRLELESRRPNQWPLVVRPIVERAATVFNLPAHQITGRNRTQTASRVRQCCMLLAYEAGLSTPEIARAFDRDASTVSHSIVQARELVAHNGYYRDRVNELRVQLSIIPATDSATDSAAPRSVA